MYFHTVRRPMDTKLAHIASMFLFIDYLADNIQSDDPFIHLATLIGFLETVQAHADHLPPECVHASNVLYEEIIRPVLLDISPKAAKDICSAATGALTVDMQAEFCTLAAASSHYAHEVGFA